MWKRRSWKCTTIGQIDDDPGASILGRTVKGKTKLKWTDNLRRVCYLSVHFILQHICRISVACPFERLERRESDNTYRVHCLGHVHGVVMTQLGEWIFSLVVYTYKLKIGRIIYSHTILKFLWFEWTNFQGMVCSSWKKHLFLRQNSLAARIVRGYCLNKQATLC